MIGDVPVSDRLYCQQSKEQRSINLHYAQLLPVNVSRGRETLGSCFGFCICLNVYDIYMLCYLCRSNELFYNLLGVDPEEVSYL